MKNSTPKQTLKDHARRVAREAETLDGFLDGWPPSPAEVAAAADVPTILATAALHEALPPHTMARLSNRTGTALVVKVPDADWVGPCADALRKIGKFGALFAHDGSMKSSHRPTSNNGSVAAVLGAGHNAAGVSQEVVAQMLDYAANGIVYWPAETMRQQFERSCLIDGRDPDDALRELLANPEGDLGAFWGQVDLNLRAGRIRMVFVADVIHPELKRIVEFLNAQISPAEVIALELRHYAGQGLRTLVPCLIGRTAEAERRKVNTGGQIAASARPTVSEWFAKFEVERGAEELALARVIHDWWVARGAKIGTTRSARPSLFAQIEHAGRVGYPASVKPSGRISTGLYAIKSLPPFDQEGARREMVDVFREIAGRVTSDRSFDGEPTLPLLLLRDQAVRNQLFSAWATLLARNQAGA